jgi:hypothetical protein
MSRERGWIRFCLVLERFSWSEVFSIASRKMIPVLRRPNYVQLRIYRDLEISELTSHWRFISFLFFVPCLVCH